MKRLLNLFLVQWTLFFIMLFGWSDPIHAAGPPLSLDDYWQKVEQTQTLVTELTQTEAKTGRDELLQAADEWERITQVKLPDNTLLAVDHSFLVAQLRADPPDSERLDRLLMALQTAQKEWPPAQHTPADLKTLDPILAQSQFQWQPARPSIIAELWKRLLKFLWELLSPLMPEQALISLDANILTLLRYALTGLVVIILIVVLGVIFWKLTETFVAEADIAADMEGTGEILSADAALKRAQQLSGAGDYRTAVRYLYLSSLLLLDERGLLRYDRSQTNREYLRGVAHTPKLAGSLRAVIDVFDRVWYGRQSLDEETYRQYTKEVDELRQQK